MVVCCLVEADGDSEALSPAASEPNTTVETLMHGGGRNLLRTSTLIFDHTAEHASTLAQGHNGSTSLRK